MAISFLHQSSQIRILLEADLKTWLSAICAEEKRNINFINYIFCSDSFLHQINIQYLQHDTLTDVISFNYQENNAGKIEGEVYISIPRVKENSISYSGGDAQSELLRVLAHGTLHLCGYEDKTTNALKIMREKEEYYLQKLSLDHPAIEFTG